jgi:hypothetical protein
MKTISAVKGVNKMSNRGIDKIKTFKFTGFIVLAVLLVILALSCQGKKQEGQISKNEANKIIKNLENTIWSNNEIESFIVFLPDFKVEYNIPQYYGGGISFNSRIFSGKIINKDSLLILSFEKAPFRYAEFDLTDFPISVQVVEENGKNVEKLFFLHEWFTSREAYQDYFIFSKIDRNTIEKFLSEHKNLNYGGDDSYFYQAFP